MVGSLGPKTGFGRLASAALGQMGPDFYRLQFGGIFWHTLSTHPATSWVFDRFRVWFRFCDVGDAGTLCCARCFVNRPLVFPIKSLFKWRVDVWLHE